MLKITSTQSTKNSLSDMTEDAEVGSKISFTTRSAKNLSASVDMAKDAEVSGGDSGDDETVNRLSLFKKPNISMEYLISPRPKKNEFLLIVVAVAEVFS